MTEHVTFRQLWAALSYAITQGKKETTLQSELSSPETIPDSPLEKLLNPRGQGRLLVECRRLADPATVVSPELDEELWSRGEPRSGAWLREAEDYGFVSCEIPFRMAQRDGQEGLERALKAFVRTKRLVALAHDAGEALVQSLCRQRSFVDRALDDERLRDALLRGLRRLFVTAEEQERAGDPEREPDARGEGLRPQVAAAVCARDEVGRAHREEEERDGRGVGDGGGGAERGELQRRGTADERRVDQRHQRPGAIDPESRDGEAEALAKAGHVGVAVLALSALGACLRPGDQEGLQPGCIALWWQHRLVGWQHRLAAAR